MVDETYEDQFDWDDAVGGGLIDNYTGVITHSEFGNDPEYNEGQTTQINWVITLTKQDDPDIDLGPGDTVEVSLNVGNVDTWEAVDGGAGVVRVDNRRPKFHESVAYGRLINAVIKGASFGDSERTRFDNPKDVAKVLRGRDKAGALKASIWTGLEFDFQRLSFSFTSDDGEDVTYSRTFPVSFVGEADVEDADDGGNTPEVDREALVKLAGKHSTFGSFLSAAMQEFDGVEDGPLAADLMDEDGGIYAEAHG